MKRSLLFIKLTIAFLFIAQINYAQEEEFPYPVVDWASYMSGQFDSNGNIIITGKTAEGDSWQPRPFQFLEPFVSNPDADAYHYMAKISADQNIEFVKLYGPPVPENPTSFDAAFSVRTLVDDMGNVYITGITAREEGIGTADGYQPDYHGNWSDPYELYIGGQWITIPPEPCFDVYIMKFDSQGQKLWGSYYNGNQEMDTGQPFVHGDYIYLEGYTTSYEGITTPGTFISDWGSELPHQTRRRFLQKIDAETGVPVWGTYLLTDLEQIEESGMGAVSPYWFTMTSEGYFVYFIKNPDTPTKMRVLAPDGSLYTEFETDVASGSVLSLETDNNNNFYLAGNTLDNDSIGTEGAYKPVKTAFKENFIEKLDINGNKFWGTYLFEPAGNIIRDIRIGIYAKDKSDVYFAIGTPEAGLATEGAYQTEHAGGYDIAFGSLNDLDGSLNWMSYYGGSGDDVVYRFSKDQEDNLYISGITNSPPEEVISENALFPTPFEVETIDTDTGHYLFIVKFKHQKNLSTKKVTEKKFLLYPNPTRNKITLQGKTPFSEKARLVVYDLLGRKIMSLPVQPSTTQEVDVAKLSSGVYFLSIEENGNKEFHRFVKE